MSHKLPAILEQIKSDKVRERQEGLEELKKVFRNQDAVANFYLSGKDGTKTDPKKWLVVFQALFTLVIQERTAFFKKDSAPVSTRLRTGASTVRWLVERTTRYMNKRVAFAIFDHLADAMVWKGNLVSIIALEYTQALKLMLSWTPHMEHLDDTIWIKLTELAFNVVLCEPLRKHFRDDKDEDEHMPPEDEDESSDGTPAPTTSKKRARSARTPASHPSSQRITPNPNAPTAEQVAFASLLCILLDNEGSPLLSPEYPYLASSVLRRLHHFLAFYPSDSSLHHDYLIALSRVLPLLSLNRKVAVTSFAVKGWDLIVGLWGTKNKSVKETLVVVIRILLPFLLVEDASFRIDPREKIRKLWRCLNGEGDGRWTTDLLSIEALRLKINDSTKSNSDFRGQPPFVYSTFAHGWHFDENEATAWAVLEIHADCLEKLYQLSEMMQQDPSAGGSRKRRRVDNPVLATLASIASAPGGGTTSPIVIYHLQLLLFIIERHWHKLHSSFRMQILLCLQTSMNVDDGMHQSWVFLCLAAAVFQSRDIRDPTHDPHDMEDRYQSSTTDTFSWEVIWAHAMRRITTPAVCRAASHFANIAIHASQFTTKSTQISAQRVISDIESIAKDLDSHGPSYPFDSVCAFMASCITIANQDARLYRMQMEDRVFAWLVGSWKFNPSATYGYGSTGAQRLTANRLPLHDVGDILSLLESICAMPQRSDLVLKAPLPSSSITNIAMEDQKTTVIRQFLLQAKLPDSRENITAAEERSVSVPASARLTASPLSTREHKCSTFLLQTVEDLCSQLEESPDIPLTAVRARRVLDAAVVSLAFETILSVNSRRANRRALQAASRLITTVLSSIVQSNWSVDEKATVLMGVEPLVTYMDEDETTEGFWLAILPPGPDSGIKKSVVSPGQYDYPIRQKRRRALRRNFLRTMWRSSDVQDALAPVYDQLRNLLHSELSCDPLSVAQDMDDFAAVTSSTAHMSSTGTRRIMEVAFCFMTASRTLQLASEDDNTNEELVEIVLHAASEHPDTFLAFSPTIIRTLRLGTLILSVDQFDAFLDLFGDLLMGYSHSRRGDLLVALATFLDSTYHIWSTTAVSTGETGRKVRQICKWLSESLCNRKVRGWKARDHLALFMENYMSSDPLQQLWSVPDDHEYDSDEEREEHLPSNVLPILSEDPDIRVRFRAAVVHANMVWSARQSGYEPESHYQNIVDRLSRNPDECEFVLTRIITLGNFMVVDSSFRSRPYWHLLETALRSAQYIRHIEAVFRCVSRNLGFPTLASLFQSYSAQLAYTIRSERQDVLRLPPHILGYEDRLQCAQASFRSFTPINLLRLGNDPSILLHGRNLFTSHCALLGKTPEEATEDCFGDIVGLQLIASVSANGNIPPANLHEVLMETMGYTDGPAFTQRLASSADNITCAVLRPLSAYDCSETGEIFAALQVGDPSGVAADSLLNLSRHPPPADFTLPPPNKPNFPPHAIVTSLSWLNQTVDPPSKALVYHVMHQLFSAIQSSSLVNEQIRLLTSITMWVAFNNQHFKDASLVHSLVQGMLLALPEPELSYAAQSGLDWVLTEHSKVMEGSRLSAVLVDIARVAYNHLSPGIPSTLTERGAGIVEWITGHTERFMRSTSTRIKEQAIKAALIWPSSFFDSRLDEVRPKTISELLKDNSSGSNFRLARRLGELSSNGRYSTKQFASQDFWSLKRSIPKSIASTRHEDPAALASLLCAHHGKVSGFSNDLYLSIADRNPVYKQSSKKEASPENPIPSMLLSLLQGNDASEVRGAYMTLRQLLSVSDLSSLSPTLSERARSEIELLAHFPPKAHNRPLRSVQELGSKPLDIESSSDFSSWIGELTVLFCDILAQRDVLFSQLPSLLYENSTFAETLFPWLVYTLLVQQGKDGETTRAISTYFTAIISYDCCDQGSAQSIINCVLYLRVYLPPHLSGGLAYNRWLHIDFTLLARRAAQCGSYTTALLFLEIAPDCPELSIIDPKTTEAVLLDIYSHIDEPDGFYGIQTSDSRQFLFKRFKHEKQWEKAFRFHGGSFESGDNSSLHSSGLVNAFHAFGFHHMAMKSAEFFTPSTAGDQDARAHLTHELGWRTETWDLPEVAGTHDNNASLYSILRSVHCDRNQESVKPLIQGALLNEMEQLRVLGMESLEEIGRVAQNLMCIHQVILWTDLDIQRGVSETGLRREDCEEFVNISPDFEFDTLEKIIAIRISLIRSARQQEEQNQIGDFGSQLTANLLNAEKSCLLQLSRAARDAGMMQIALNAVTSAQRLDSSSSFELAEEFAQVLWAQSERKMALEHLKRLVHQNKDGLSDGLSTAKLLSCLGAWASEARLEKPSDIMDQFFDPAIAIIKMQGNEEDTSSDARAVIYHQYATFAEQQYHAIIKSPDTARVKLYMDRKNHEMEARKQQIRASQASQIPAEQANISRLQNEQRKAERQLSEDTDRFNKHNRVLLTSLHRAVDMHARCLESSDLFDDDGPIRLCSLWFSNFTNNAVQREFEAALQRVPSRKFVFLAHQLSARLGKPGADTAAAGDESLRRILKRMCREHPFHSLYQVYCLQSDGPRPVGSKRRQSTRHEISSSQTERSAAASDLLGQLRTDEHCGERVRNVERLCDAFLDWATYPIKGDKRYTMNKKNGTLQIPQDRLLLKLNDTEVPIPTIKTPLDLTLRYESCVCVKNYEPTFTTAGGVNLPKISLCVGTDGRKYKQLFKGEGNDDLRQDAVMEQVFDLCNRILRRDKTTSKRTLRVRSYVVLPLSPQAGVLEFVHNTSPLSAWLHSAHARYHPDDLKSSVATSKLKERENDNPEARVSAYTFVRERFKPVMRHYFTERTKEPISWFTMRLCYSRSVATTSIVGHILGLGDRHISNILQDVQSGEVIHIDLGIAFDQGRALPVPERVPFRLTPDIVDGLGMSATQGVFQRCAEETMRVMREGSHIIMTVLEVFKYDPLHSWTASELKVKKLQPSAKQADATSGAFRLGIDLDMSSGNAAENADRALSGVARKLDKTMSVEFTVNELISEATDFRNLATIYYGWGPHL